MNNKTVRKHTTNKFLFTLCYLDSIYVCMRVCFLAFTHKIVISNWRNGKEYRRNEGMRQRYETEKEKKESEKLRYERIHPQFRLAFTLVSKTGSQWPIRLSKNIQLTLKFLFTRCYNDLPRVDLHRLGSSVHKQKFNITTLKYGIYNTERIWTTETTRELITK